MSEETTGHQETRATALAAASAVMGGFPPDMKTFTTRAAGKLVNKELGERARQLGLVRAENESGTVCVEMTSDEADDFERAGHAAIDSDVIADALMDEVVAYLKEQSLVRLR